MASAASQHGGGSEYQLSPCKQHFGPENDLFGAAPEPDTLTPETERVGQPAHVHDQKATATLGGNPSRAVDRLAHETTTRGELAKPHVAAQSVEESSGVNFV